MTYTKLNLALCLLLIFAHLSFASTQPREEYTSAECESLEQYTLELLAKKHARLAEKMVGELTHNCPLSKKIASKAVYLVSHDPEISLRAAKIVALMGGSRDDALRTATYWQRTETVRYLLSHGADVYSLIDTADDMALSNFIPLFHYAIQQGYIEAVQLMITSGYDINSSYKKMTPLMVAAWYGQNDIVKLLLKQGAQANARDNDGYTALDYALGIIWARLDESTLKQLKEAYAASCLHKAQT